MRGGDAGGGPDYGAKGLLFAGSVSTIATGSTNFVVTSCIVPAKEDWYPTEWDVFSTVAGSVAAVYTLLNGASALTGSGTITGSAGVSIAGAITPDSQEEEGTRVVAASVLSVQAATGTTTAPTNVQVRVWGYRRYPTGFRAV